MSQKRARIGRSEECEKIEPHIFPAKFSHICYEFFFVKEPITKYNWQFQVEDDDDNVKHFLPTDLLLETTMSLSSSSSPTARGKKATVRHAESVNPLAFSTDEGEQGQNGLGSEPLKPPK